MMVVVEALVDRCSGIALGPGTVADPGLDPGVNNQPPPWLVSSSSSSSVDSALWASSWAENAAGAGVGVVVVVVIGTDTCEPGVVDVGVWAWAGAGPVTDNDPTVAAAADSLLRLSLAVMSLIVMIAARHRRNPMLQRCNATQTEPD